MLRHLPYCVLLLLVACFQRPAKMDALSKILTLPNFTLYTIDSSAIQNARLNANGHPSVYIYFDPGCEHCQREIRDISDHLDSLGQLKIFLIANDTSAAVNAFVKAMKLDVLPNIFVGKDYNFEFYRIFHPSSVPYIVVYNAKGKLTTIVKGEADAQSLLRASLL